MNRSTAATLRRLALAGLCLLVGVRAAGPLSGPVFGDEIPILGNVLHFAQERTLVPTHFNYPTLFSYLLAAWTGMVAALHWVVGGQHPVDFAFGMAWSIGGSAEFSPELAALRLLVVSLAMGLVLASYRLGREAWGPGIGLGTAALVAASATLAERSAWVVPDVLVAVLVTLAVTCCVRHVQRQAEGAAEAPGRDLALASLLAGAAFATKYNGALAAVAIAAAWWLAGGGGAGTLLGRVAAALRAGGRLAAIMLVAIVACLPALIVVPGDYWRLFRQEAQHMVDGQILVGLGERPFLWIGLRLLEVEGVLGALLIAGGLSVLLFRKDRVAWVLVLPVVAAILAVGTWRYTSLHYLLWALPLVAALTARAVQRLSPVSPGLRLLPVLLVAGAMLPAVAEGVVRSVREVRTPANQRAAERWVEARVSPGSRVDQDWYSVPTLWSAEIRDRYLALIDQHPGPLGGRRPAGEGKPLFVGNLGFPPEPPLAEHLRRDRPEWVVTSAQTEPQDPEPLVGYGAEHLRVLHRQLAEYYHELRTGGGYRVEAEFRQGAGPAVTVYRRVAGSE